MNEKDLRDLDARVHREVVCLPVRTDPHGHHWTDEIGLLGCNAVPRYSTDIGAAWLVVEKLVSQERIDMISGFKEVDVEAVRSYGMGRWFFSFCNGTGEYGETAPVAICNAALAAVSGGGPLHK